MGYQINAVSVREKIARRLALQQTKEARDNARNG